MKRFWNWKTALVGILTALILTGVATGAYHAYVRYLEKNYGAVSSVHVTSNSQGGEAEYVVVTSTDGESIETEGAATPSVEKLRELFAYHYVFFKELCDNKLAREGREPTLRYQDLLFGDVPPLNLPSDLSEVEKQEWQQQYESVVRTVRDTVENYLFTLQTVRFAEFNKNCDYWIIDKANPSQCLTNTQIREPGRIDLSKYAYMFQVDYDEHGVPSIADRNLYASDVETMRKNVNSVLHENAYSVLGASLNPLDMEDTLLREAIDKACKVKNPINCSIIIGITWSKYKISNEIEYGNNEWSMAYNLFDSLSVRVWAIAILAVAFFCGVFYLNPRQDEKRAKRELARAPVELVVALGMLLYSGYVILHMWMTNLYLRYDRDYVSLIMYVFFYLLVAWYVGGCIGEIRAVGFRKYFGERFLLVIACRALHKHVKKLFEEYRKLNLGMNLRGKILRLVIINAIVVSVFCAVWFFGIIGVLLYSICLYFLVMQYIVAVQKDYRELQRMTKEMADGNLKYEPERSLGLFEPVKEDLVLIRNGFDKAVQEEVKSHKLKNELITNVSHDLKTPLTAIITYVNLLKDKNLTEEQIQSYVNTLDQKSLRLKRLIEDLFEVSKANSGNVQLNLQNCDLANLIKQCFYEVEDKLEEKNLTTRLSMPEERVVLRLDSEKTYRIYENLFHNIAKYAMAGTRVYVTMSEEEDLVTVTIKNITEAELYVPAEELTERFVRGDASRGSVEGSGLGLAIARSFTEIQGGKFALELDGDLFKVTTTWRKPARPAEE
ncbi:MAG: HAMP domain-containing histidine kinase [Lachnospiraceae bacterium]|nr:HAMP domain-containing histidine kinase [Lachnospiraceae bacterium]